MPLTNLPPRTIRIYGIDTVENSRTAGAAITPGMLIEYYKVSGAIKWRPHSGAANVPTLAVALEQRIMNLGIDTAYGVDDLVEAGFMEAGDKFYAILVSGATAADGDFLQSNGDGKLKAATAVTAAADVGRFQCLDNVGTVGADTRVRVQVIA